jgi:carboxyl-terminal processing protease
LHADSIHFPDSLKYKTLVNNRTVYGGGGIMPDYFVPIDTTSLTDLHRDLIAKGIVNRIAIMEVDNRRNSLLKAYPDVDAFKKDYSIPADRVTKMKKMAEEEKVEWDEEEFERSEKLLFTQLKALIARDIYDSSAYFKIINDENEIFQEGLRIIKTPEKYNDLLM